MPEIQLPAADLTKALLTFERQPSGLYLPRFLESTAGAAHVSANSVVADTGEQTERKSIGTISAESSAINATSALVTPSVDCYFRQGAPLSNTAVVPTKDGAAGDQLLIGGNTYRVSGIVSGNSLAFITESGSGEVLITPGA